MRMTRHIIGQNKATKSAVAIINTCDGLEREHFLGFSKFCSPGLQFPEGSVLRSPLSLMRELSRLDIVGSGLN